jgi:hypothetical protein
MRVVYMVTHKHRLRDCHGSLTFTRKGLRFDSDEPEDSFDVAVDEVTIEGDVLSIRNKPWRFEFTDGVRVSASFKDWKAEPSDHEACAVSPAGATNGRTLSRRRQANRVCDGRERPHSGEDVEA